MRYSRLFLRAGFCAAFVLCLTWLITSTAPQPAAADHLQSVLSQEQFDQHSADDLSAQMQSGAGQFVSVLPDSRRELNDPQRTHWDFWPSRYPGARIDQITAAQAALADQLLRLGLSAQGYEKVKLIQTLEPDNPWSSPYYSVMVFGEPASGRPWGWRFQGHHLSINFTLSGGAISTTPMFLGTQPLSKSSVAGGKAPLGDEEHLARRLYTSLDAAQRRAADIQRPPHTYLPERTPAAVRPRPMGVLAKALSAGQQATLRKLIDAYIGNAAPAIAEQRRREINQGDFDSIRFAWAGPAEPHRDHYYRIQGREFLIEYDSRDGGSHIHSVWRSFDGDFGEDLLRKHLETAHLGRPLRD